MHEKLLSMQSERLFCNLAGGISLTRLFVSDRLFIPFTCKWGGGGGGGHHKSLGAIDTLGMASFDPRGLIGRI